jgi:hypothetical protein
MSSVTPARKRPLSRGVPAAVTPLLLLAALAGCDGDAAAGSTREQADTAQWALGAPAARAGNAAGDELHRVYGGLLRDDGSFVVGNSATSELRVYDRAGRLLKAAGRRGAGPGEFGSINWLAALPGDSLVVFDLRHHRFSIWTADGRFVRTFRPQSLPGPVRPIGVLEDGSLLLVREGRYDPRAGAGVVRDSMLMLRMDRNGEVVQTLGSFAGAEWLVYEHPTSFRATQLPFGPSGHLAVAGTGFVHASSEDGRLAMYDASARQVRSLTIDVPRRDITPREVSELLGEIQDVSERGALARYYRETKAAPVFTALKAARDGNLWIRLFPPAGVDSVKWVVLTPAGERIGSLRMHASWLPLDIGPREVLVRETDADGVQGVSIRTVLR